MAVCLDEIHKELKLEEPRPGKHAGSMEIYLRDFEERFTPFIGEDDSRSLKQDIAILFESNDSEDHLNLVTGFIALKKFQREGAIDKPHTDAAIAALFLAKEQLEATADIIEYC